MKTFMKYIGGILLSLGASILTSYASVFLYARYYAFQLGVPLNTLSNDYGMAFEITGVAFIAFVFVLILGSWLTHRIITSKSM